MTPEEKKAYRKGQVKLRAARKKAKKRARKKAKR